MKAAGLLLRARLLLARSDPLLALVLALGLACAAMQLALAPALTRLDAEHAAARQAAGTPLPPRAASAAPAPAGDQNLRDFHAALGARRGVERPLKDMFALAAHHGLVLRQGEYRVTGERDAALSAYQVSLPLKGSHGAIWAFAMDVLRAIPHAALDDVAFRRDSISEAGVDARLRLTLYLGERVPPRAAAQLGHKEGSKIAIARLVPRATLIGASAEGVGEGENGLFARHDWTPPPPPPSNAPPAPSAPPGAPPLPFTYLGKSLQNGVWEIYLARGHRTYAVRDGANLDGAYRVDAIRPPLLMLTYLPLEQPQQLTIGGFD